ncbi:MAG: two-component system, OmpR family, response regulator [Solirubrobacterales bacterium]|jgi:DNA-binding response OmpR family regulator|nr:two-component system, OmpR family, response regulator [Solirubrobacterales bacterium]
MGLGSKSVQVLIIEDEAGIARLLEQALGSEGFETAVASDGEEGERLALTGDFDLVLLDVMLPGRGGREVLAAIRDGRPQLPVIMLTALGEKEDVVAGLDLGADDYVTKPFDLDELLARIRAQLRRPPERDPGRLEAADIKVDLHTREVWRAGTGVHLTAREFELLVYLMRHPNEVLSREQILNSVWGYDHDPGTNVLSVYVNYLRRKLTVDGDPPPIETVRSAGFRLVIRGG